jgi:NAD+ diphosphatase
MHSIIAGFVEPGESLEMAVVREVEEETGIRVRNISYFSSQPWPFPRSLMLGFTAEAVTEEIHLNDGELDAAGWFSREEIVSGLADGTFDVPTSVSISHRLIEAWFDAGEVGRLRDIKHD